jgi:hypothetical protein
MGRGVFPAITFLGILLVSLFSSTAQAESATVRLKKGGKVSGELVEYVPGDHVTLGLPGGKISRIPASDLKSVQIGAPSARAEEPTRLKPAPAKNEPDGPQAVPVSRHTAPPVHITDGAQVAVIQGLMAERADWQSRDTGLAVPIIFTIAGAGLIGLGVGLHSLYEHPGGYSSSDGWEEYSKDSTFNVLSIVSLISGAVTLTAAGVFWALRTSDSRQEQELQRIDNQLMLYGVHASVSPWFVPPTTQGAGASGGMTFTLKL